MAFRDDREALRAKKEVLEDEVEELKRALYQAEKQLAAHEKKDAADEGELERLRKEVGSLKKRLGVADPEDGNSRWVWLGALGVAILLVAGMGGYWHLSAASDREAELVDARDLEPPGSTPAPAPAPPAVPEPPESSAFDAAYFGAVVVATEGMNAQAGDGCVLQVELSEAPRRVQVHCRELIHASRPTHSVLTYAAGEGEEIDGYALRTSAAAFMVDTARHEILVEPREGAFARLYVDALGVAGTGVDAPDDALPFEGEGDADPGLVTLLRALEADATCEVSGSFDGRMHAPPREDDPVALRASGRSLHTTTVNGRVVENVETTRRELTTPIGTVSGVPEVDCERRLVVLEEGESRASARFGPGYVTLVGILETPEETGTFWMRRTAADPAEETVELGVDVNVETSSNIGSLPPHVQEAVRRAIQEAEE
jgi:hypothetical protein